MEISHFQLGESVRNTKEMKLSSKKIDEIALELEFQLEALRIKARTNFPQDQPVLKTY